MLALLLAIAIAAPIPHEEAVADVWHLARLLEHAHPDPFLRGGGRVAFYQAVDDVLRDLPEGDIEPAVLRDHLLPIVARVGDEHRSARLDLREQDAGGEGRELVVRDDDLSDGLARFEVDGLTPGTAYEYRIAVDGDPDRGRGMGSFRSSSQSTAR